MNYCTIHKQQYEDHCAYCGHAKVKESVQKDVDPEQTNSKPTRLQEITTGRRTA